MLATSLNSSCYFYTKELINITTTYKKIIIQGKERKKPGYLQQIISLTGVTNHYKNIGPMMF